MAELFQGTVSFRLDAVAIEHQAPVVVVGSRNTQTTVGTLRRLVTARRPFPIKLQPGLTLIPPVARATRSWRTLSARWHRARLRRFNGSPTSMHRSGAPGKIAQADLVQPVLHRLERGLLVGHEEHALVRCQRGRDDVRDGLGLARARGPSMTRLFPVITS